MPTATLKARLDQKLADAVADGGEETVYRDTEIPGFALAVRQGSASWCMFVRNRGRQTTLTLGRADMVSADYARDMARQVRATGRFPREFSGPTAVGTVGEAAAAWAEAGYPGRGAAPKKPSRSSVRENDRILANYVLPEIGDVPVSEVDVSHVESVLDRCPNAPYQRNRVRSLLVKVFDYAARSGMRDPRANPARQVIPSKEKRAASDL